MCSMMGQTASEAGQSLNTCTREHTPASQHTSFKDIRHLILLSVLLISGAKSDFAVLQDALASSELHNIV
jgi:hypothetical protein